MKKQATTVIVNPRVLRQLRVSRGWTQEQLAKRAGYSERLIRKAELGGHVRARVLIDLAECLSTESQTVNLDMLTHDPLRVAQLWMTSFDQLGVKMLEAFGEHLAEDFVFHCGGNVSTFPFNGTFHGIEGHQQWLDAFFGVFVRKQGIDVNYTSGPETATARWMESVYLHGILCPPVRVNLHFFFRNGLLIRIEDDYDTQAGAEIQAAILEHLGQADESKLRLDESAWRPERDC